MTPDGAMNVRPVRMFVSYSHENAAWCKRLLPLLKVKANVDTLQPWHDTELKAGDRWDKEIRAELEQMDIFVCLVSYQYLSSHYIQNVELPIVKKRYMKGEIEVVPVLLYPMDLKQDSAFLHQFNLFRNGERLGATSRRTVTGITRFIQSEMVSSRRSREHALEAEGSHKKLSRARYVAARTRKKKIPLRELRRGDCW
jgi:hypothetical protein